MWKPCATCEGKEKKKKKKKNKKEEEKKNNLNGEKKCKLEGKSCVYRYVCTGR